MSLNPEASIGKWVERRDGSPSLPGGATRNTEDRAKVEGEIRDVIAFHLEGMPDDGAPVRYPSSQVESVEVAASREGRR